MQSAHSRFVDFWAKLQTRTSPFVHPDDAAHIHAENLSLNLLPVPVNGSLVHAEALVLMLNPGLDPDDEAWERREDFRESLVHNLKQDHLATSHPLNYLNPLFRMHPGAGYWSRSRGLSGGKRDPQKLSSLIHAVAERDDVSIESAQMHVARKVAIVQLCPYHSKKKPSSRLLRDLPSCKLVRDLVQAVIDGDQKLVVATRSVAEWGFKESINIPHLVVYPGNLGASASLTLSSEGGKALLRKISRATKSWPV
jgi:hypothetical protein